MIPKRDFTSIILTSGVCFFCAATLQVRADDGVSIVLNVSEDAYLGDAQFTVAVDGLQVGGIRTATASHAAGQTQSFTLPGFSAGSHIVSVTFLNDAWGGSASLDRNLHVDAISIGGATIRENREQGSNGTVSYVVAPPPVVAIVSQSLGPVTLQGTVTGAPGTIVDVFNADTVVGLATVAPDGTWAYTASLPAGGLYALHAIARDPNGYVAATRPAALFATPGALAAPTLAHPFAADSPWNTTLLATAAYEGDAGPLTTALRTGAVPWVGANTVGIYAASSSDPLANWTYQSSNGLPASGPGEIKIPTPSGVQFLGGSDQLAIIVLPDRKTYYEVWLGTQGAMPNSFSAAYLVANSIDDTGFGTRDRPSHGIRAAGSSLLAGLVRVQELADLDIPHAIAMIIASNQAAKGTTQQSQFVPPATGADANSLTAYSGTIPLGTRFAIPSAVDLSTIGVKTPLGMALAKAYQLYGGYVVDTSPNTDHVALLEAGASAQQVDDLMADVGAIRAHLNAVLAAPAR